MQESDRWLRFGIDLIKLDSKSCIADLVQLFISNREELYIMSRFSLEVDRELLLFSFKELLVKALSTEVGDFIDLNKMVISSNSTGISVNLGAEVWRANLHGAIANRYLVTAVTLVD